MVKIAAVSAVHWLNGNVNVLDKNTVREQAFAPLRPKKLNVDMTRQGCAHLHCPLLTKMAQVKIDYYSDAPMLPVFLAKAATITVSLCTVR